MAKVKKVKKVSARERALESWRSGPLSRWRKDQAAQEAHRLRALVSWAPGGALHEARLEE